MEQAYKLIITVNHLLFDGKANDAFLSSLLTAVIMGLNQEL
jgi:hypothetical protein